MSRANSCNNIENKLKENAMTDEKRMKSKELAKRLAVLTQAQRMELFKLHPVITIEGHTMSLCNTCLLWFQNDGVTVVGGYRQWQAAGRQVRRGEHGLVIWFPVGPKKDENKPEGFISRDDLDTKFFLGMVFDISQTDEREKENDT